MRTVAAFFAGILSVIAVGVLAIAYGVLYPRAAAADGGFVGRPAYASDRLAVIDDEVRRPLAMPVNDARALPVSYTPYDALRPRALSTRPVSYQPRPARASVAPGRDWMKTALVIGGTTAAGAGLGGVFGGKKGALIGAAIGGGASTLYEATKR